MELCQIGGSLKKIRGTRTPHAKKATINNLQGVLPC